MKRVLPKVLLGILVSILIMGGVFFLFYFWNPMGVYSANTLRWIPLLAGTLAVGLSGRINRNTPVIFLPLLLLPFVMYRLFNFAYFPFLFVLLGNGFLLLLMTRASLGKWVKALVGVVVIGLFLGVLFSQPLLIQRGEEVYNEAGNLVSAKVLWDFSDQEDPVLPSHTFLTVSDEEFSVSEMEGTPYVITFWATWCGPCLEEKPALEACKGKYGDDIRFVDVSIDEDAGKWKAFLERKNPAGLQLLSEAPFETQRAFGFSGIPMHLLVSADGTYKKISSFEGIQSQLRARYGEK